MNLKDFFEAIDYKINEGSEYQWVCFGNHAYALDSFGDDYNVGVVFDTRNQIVYQISVFDYKKSRAYRWHNPLFIQSYQNESAKRNISFAEAWDDTNFVDLEVEADILEKIHAIVNDKPYDERVQVIIDLDDDILYRLMTMAHEKDITLNQLVNEILRNYLKSK